MHGEEYGTLDTPWGRIGLYLGASGIQRLLFDVPSGPVLVGEWAQVLTGYVAGCPIPDDVPVDLAGLSPFTRQVLLACRAIPYGGTMTYGQLAAQVGRSSRAARAIGQALGRNPAPIIIPCHRVIGAHGQLTGFLGGLDWKRRLLQHERH
jgi:methylated-DNA-[protein]-cysteine S-methyltransferase